MVSFSPVSPGTSAASLFLTKVRRLLRLEAAPRAGGAGGQSEPPLGSVHRGGCFDDRNLYLIIYLCVGQGRGYNVLSER